MPAFTRAFLSGISPLGEISYYRTKSLQSKLSRRARLRSNIFLIRASAHPRGAFLYNRKFGGISYYTEKEDSQPEILFL